MLFVLNSSITHPSFEIHLKLCISPGKIVIKSPTFKTKFFELFLFTILILTEPCMTKKVSCFFL
jgi:hypothetical protein